MIARELLNAGRIACAFAVGAAITYSNYAGAQSLPPAADAPFTHFLVGWAQSE